MRTPSANCSAPWPCECVDWCRDGVLDKDTLSLHHPRCQHYKPSPPDPRLAIFGALMWNWINNEGGDFCWREESEDILPLAQQAGLCSRVIYDPEKHGDIEADTGDEIWFWGEENNQPEPQP